MRMLWFLLTKFFWSPKILSCVWKTLHHQLKKPLVLEFSRSFPYKTVSITKNFWSQTIYRFYSGQKKFYYMATQGNFSTLRIKFSWSPKAKKNSNNRGPSEFCLKHAEIFLPHTVENRREGRIGPTCVRFEENCWSWLLSIIKPFYRIQISKRRKFCNIKFASFKLLTFWTLSGAPTAFKYVRHALHKQPLLLFVCPRAKNHSSLISFKKTSNEICSPRPIFCTVSGRFDGVFFLVFKRQEI
jgi:hypothetical protein